MKKVLVIMAILAQVMVLAYMAGEREYIVQNGRTVYLRTAPIDPRDLFRGDYVRLHYDISTVPVTKVRGSLMDEEERKKGIKVYAFLKEGEGGIADVDFMTDRKADHGVFIKGRIDDDWRTRSRMRAVTVKYGIESYYVQQGKGRDIEKKRGTRSGIQVPLEMEVALGGSGTAVIRGHRWSRLGMGFEAVEIVPRDNKGTRKSATFRLTLMNASDAPLAIVDLPDACSFSLEAVAWSREDHPLISSACNEHIPSDKDVVVLQPEQTRSFAFDLSDPRWRVLEGGKGVVEPGTLERTELFRMVYRPPSHEECTHLENKDLIWHGSLPSRAFHGRGYID